VSFKISQLVACWSVMWATRVQFPLVHSFLSIMSITALEVITLIYVSVFALFFFSSSFFHIWEGEEHSWFLNMKGWKTPTFWNIGGLHIDGWYGTHLTRVTGSQDFEWSLLRMQRKQKCATPRTLLFSWCTRILHFLLQLLMQLHLHSRKLLGVTSLAAYHAYLIIFL
jgi:hypothetical protein